MGQGWGTLAPQINLFNLFFPFWVVLLFSIFLFIYFFFFFPFCCWAKFSWPSPTCAPPNTPHTHTHTSCNNSVPHPTHTSCRPTVCPTIAGALQREALPKPNGLVFVHYSQSPLGWFLHTFPAHLHSSACRTRFSCCTIPTIPPHSRCVLHHPFNFLCIACCIIPHVGCQRTRHQGNFAQMPEMPEMPKKFYREL